MSLHMSLHSYASAGAARATVPGLYSPAPSTTSPALTWHDGLLMGYPPMDEEHEIFVDLISAMKAAADRALGPLLEAFAAHAKAHFESENRWMSETGFPARDCHIAEHTAVMRSVDAVRERLARGDCAVVRRLIAELETWFPGHAIHLDSALAHWLSKLRLGGKPVVVRRNIQSSGTLAGIDPLNRRSRC